MTVLLITLLIVGVAELVTVTANEAIVTARRHRGLAHEVAVDSALLVLAERLSELDRQPKNLIRELDRFGQAAVEFRIGQVRVECTIRDDAGKLNPVLFQEPHERPKLERKLNMLQLKRSLPRAKVDLRPAVTKTRSESAHPLYHWYDQILSDVRPGSLFRWNEGGYAPASAPVWSDAITFWGDGRIALRRVDVNVLEAALEDIRPGLAKILLAARPADPSVDFVQTALIGIDAEIRQRVAARLTYDAHRYAIAIDTSMGGDRRRWYAVADVRDGEVNVLHRSRLTW